MLNKAIQIATEAHKDQFDKAGKPYILHPLRVMLHCENEAEQICAILHDVVEDSDVTFDDLRSHGFSEEIISALDCLTKRDGESYNDFISRVLANELASRVKLADLRDNMDLTRIAHPNDQDFARIEKYRKAVERITSAYDLEINTQPVFDTILKRRSIRRFLDQAVPRDLVTQLLQAAMAAPSACNLQPWTFIVVDEPEPLQQLKDATTIGQYNAPLAIVVCGATAHIPWPGEGWRQDCGGAIQNLLLAAVELNLATVCIASFEEAELSKLLHLPEDIVPICIVEVGYPAEERESITWYTDEAVHWQAFDPTQQRTYRTLDMLRGDK